MDRRQAGLARLLAGLEGRRTNIALLVLLVLALASGVAIFALGTGWAVAAVVVHGIVGLAPVVLTGPKWRISRRGLDRRSLRATWPSMLLAVLVVVTVASGVGHSLGLVLTWGPLDDMQVHVGAAVLLVPVAVWHVLARGQVPERHDLARRNLVRGGVVLGAAGVVLGVSEAVSRAADLPGSRRRFTGSLEEASHVPAAMPSIIWLFDPRPVLSGDDWRLTLSDGAGTTILGLDELSDDDRGTAVLDCTSGWWAEQDWHGVWLERLLDVPDDAASVTVRSVTGYWRRFPLRDMPSLLLATGYEGRPLAPRHGFPARLVAPGRRGFWWVKWIDRIEVTATPWWRQPPFPLQ